MSSLGQHNGNGIRYSMHLSAPKGGAAQMLCDPSGAWVAYEEYARLKAEVESLMTNPTSRLLRAEREENARLKADVERLTKAGDAMEVLIVGELAFYEDDGSHYDEVKAWNAAKEGKQP